MSRSQYSKDQTNGPYESCDPLRAMLDSLVATRPSAVGFRRSDYL